MVRLRDRRQWIIAAFLIVVVWIAWRNAPLYPIVFSDEYTYSMGSRWLPFSDAAIPSYLFFAIYRSTLLCSDGFLACARLLNLLWFAAATPLIWLVAQRVLKPGLAAWIALLAAASPFNVYTAAFIPESLYFLGFWVVMWFATRAATMSDLHYWSGLGLLAGMLALLKPHGLFLLPALMLHGAIVTTTARRSTKTTLVGHLTLFVVVVFVVKLGGGYLFAGSRGVTLFGSYYSAATGPLHSGDGSPWRLVALTGFVLKGHGMALALLFAMPSAVLLSVLAATNRRAARDPRWQFCVLTTLVVASLVVMSATYTATVASVPDVAPSETVHRLHLRYYDFAFPLLVIVGGIAVAETPRSQRVGRIGAALLAIVVVLVAVAGLRDHDPGLIDGPELYGVAVHATARRLTALLALGSLALLSWRPRVAPYFFVFVFMPWVDLKGTQAALGQLADRSRPDTYDAAGRFARERSTRAEIARTRVIGDDAAGVYRALFHLDDARAIFTVSPPGQPITSVQMAAPHDRALVIGDHPIVGDDLRSVSSHGATLVWKAAAPADTAPR